MHVYLCRRCCHAPPAQEKKVMGSSSLTSMESNDCWRDSTRKPLRWSGGLPVRATPRELPRRKVTVVVAVVVDVVVAKEKEDRKDRG